MDTDNVCRFCGLQTSPSCSSSQGTMTSSSKPSVMSSFVTSLRHSPWAGKRLHSLLWTYVFSLILVSTTVMGLDQRFLQEPNNVSVTQGRVVVLNCTVANQQGMVQWTQNRVALGGGDRSLPGYPRYSMIGSVAQSSSEWALQIRDVSLEDDGEYECQAGPTASVQGIRSRSAFVTVVIPPEHPTIDGAPTIPIVLHRPTNITCRANNGKPAATITWHMDGERKIEKVYSRSHPRPEEKFVDTVGMYTINASKSDSGKRIECRARNQFMDRPMSTFATLDVQYAPEITMSVNLTGTIREYNYVRFTCAGVANPPEITWRWFRNNQLLEGETNNILIIHQISYDYNGDTIACTAANRVGRTRKEMTLRVEYGPRIINVDPVVGADLQRSTELHCQADGNPQPHIIWTRKDRGSPTPQTLSTSATYKIEVVTRASFGVYVCTASSTTFPDASKDVLLLQNGKPSIRSEKEQYAAEGEKGKLECIAHSVPKPDRMVWLKDGRPIDYATSGRFSSEEKDLLYGRTNILHILNVQKEDFGHYNCNVVNSYGTDNATITLVEKSVPPLPYIIGGAVGGVAVLFIIALACVLYQRYKREDSGSVLGSTTDTDSSAEKKRKDADSPSTLMDQWRQDYNKKDFYRYSADYDELNYKQEHTGNNNAYGCLEPSEPYREPTGGGHSRAMTPLERYEAVYGPSAYSMSSFRGRERVNIDMNDAKLATDV
ncbi:kin of IRRE-like protein 1 [Littorina saxatilis]|uniref:kin of IRRE-like protein 1 n=1 Tax=Littorina saxatilis TaxID=31220 RepID=UPI0038B5457F